MSDESSFSRYFWQGTIAQVSDKSIDNTKNRVYLVMGPIGAGKSRFIESLAGNDDLQISRDQLDSFTRGITAYELINTQTSWYGPVDGVFIRPPGEPGTVIIDTPGFSDNQISEVEIIQMVNKWLNAHNCEKIHGILYLCPITDTRLSGSKRRTIQMLKLLAGINTETQGAIIVVTTMWDRLWSDRAKAAAEERFSQLRGEIWADLHDPDKVLTRFLNTHESALDVLSAAVSWMEEKRKEATLYDAYDPQYSGEPNEAPFGPHLYQDLLDRIQNVQQQKNNLESELADPEVQSHPELKMLLEKQLKTDTQLLMKFEKQLVEFGDPPVGFEHVIPLRQAVIEKHRQPIIPAAPPVPEPTAQAKSGASPVKRVWGRGIKTMITKFGGRK